MLSAIGGAAVLGPDAGKILVPLAKALGTRAGRAVPSRYESWKQRRALKKILGVGSESSFYYRLPSTKHPLLQLDNPHPDDTAAFAAIAGPLLTHARRHGWLEEVDQLDVDLAQNLVTIGSPEVEPIVQLAFDYRRPSNGPGLKHHGETIDLAYRWHEDPSDVQAICGRFLAGHGRVDRPNWPIIQSLPDGTERRLIPRVDSRTGLLDSDLLLITSMPNFLTRTALESGHRLINVAGVHGVGTAAIELVLKSPKILNAAAEAIAPLDRTSAFQILVEIAEIEHRETTGSRAKKVRLLDVWTEDKISFDGWLSASVCVAERFADWALESEHRNQPGDHERR